MKLFLTALLIACSISLSFSVEGLGDSNRTKELVEILSDSYDFWMSFDNYSSIDEIIPIEKRLEDWRIKNGLSKDNMTTLFVQIIQEHLLKLEKKPDGEVSTSGYGIAMRYLGCYPPPQDIFMDLVKKTAALDPKSTDDLFRNYMEAYPDWIFDDKQIIETIQKAGLKTLNINILYRNMRAQIRKETDKTRKKKLLDKAFEWAFQDDKLEIFHYLDRLLLDHYDKDYATNPRRKLQLEKDLKRYEEAKNYGWVYRRTKYALEHFGEGGEAFKMLYEMDTDTRLHDGEWERSERKRRSREHIEEMKKAGKDPSSIYSKKYLEDLYKD